jgi:diaminopimelate epimerase
MALKFSKMHGAGNDFVLLDLRGGRADPDAATVRAIADRHTGVGFDQLLAVVDSGRGDCLAGYRIWNSDGSAAQQCGNGARCVAAWLVRDGAAKGAGFVLDSPAGPIAVDCLPGGRYALDMGRPVFAPAQIPLRASHEQERYEWRERERTIRFGAASMGNPHALIEVEDSARAPVARAGGGAAGQRSVSARRERRLRAVAVALADPPARGRAWRRRNPRLRQRCLRGGGYPGQAGQG